MKYSEMNDNQKSVFNTVVREANELIGGLENNIEDGIEVEKSKSRLANHDALVQELYLSVRDSSLWKNQNNSHLVTLAWMRERCEKRVKKMGY